MLVNVGMGLVKGLRLTAILLVLGLAGQAWAGPTPAAKCEANKLKTAGKYGQCLLKALAKAAKKKAPEADYTRCDSKFVGKWAKIEAKGGCATTGDDTSVAAAVIDHPETATFLTPATASVSAGSWHNCSRDVSGSVQCWGLNEYQQSRSHPGTFTQVSAGADHTCAINSSGTVECWGAGSWDNGPDPHFGQSNPPSGTFTGVSAGEWHACGINSSGTVECWGAGECGETGGHDWVGHEIHVSQSCPPAGTFTQLSAGQGHTCALNSSGAGECRGTGPTDRACSWGGGYECGQAGPPEAPFPEISAGTQHTCAINSTGAVECWGAGGCDGSESYSLGQSCPPSGTFTQVSAGWIHTCAINSAGAVECWGAGGCDDGGTPHFGQSCSPAGTFTEVSAGAWHTCALNSSGESECWGANPDGQASPPAAPRCWSKPFQLVGKYGSCRLKMDAKAVKKATNPDYSKCDAKFTNKWVSVASKETESCPAIAGLESAFQAEVVSYTDDIAAMLASE